MTPRAPWFLVWLLATVFAMLLWQQRAAVSMLERLDQWTLDAQTLWRGPLQPASAEPIVLVTVDDASLQRLGGVVPGRAELARAVRLLHAGGARAIALDMLLLEPSKGERAADDAALAAALRAADPVLIPFALPDQGRADQAPSARLLAQTFAHTSNSEAEQRLARYAYQPTQLLAPLPALADAAAALGHVSVPRSSDGSLRWDFPALALDGEAYPSLALRLAVQARGLDWREATVRYGEAVDIGPLHVPLDELSRLWVNYYGPAGQFERLSLVELLDGKVAPARLAGRIAILGVSALGAGDHFPSPFDAGLPGVERLATVVDNILSGRALQRPRWAGAAELAAMLCLPALAVGLLAWWPPRRALPSLALLALALLALAQAQFVQQQRIFSLAFPALALGAACLGAISLRAGVELARKRAALQALQASEQRYALAAQGANDGLWDWDLRSQQVYYSARWLALMGLDEAQAGQGMAAWTLPLDEAERRAFDAELQAHLQGRSLQFHHVLHFHQGGQERWLLARGLATRAGGQVLRMAGSLTDISEARRLQQQISFDALHDRLTGLANRALFREQLQQLLQQQPGAGLLILLGLDEFRALNEAHGTLAGDAVLRETAARLRALVGERGGLLARLGGDEFGIALACGPAERLPAQVLAALEAPVQIGAGQVLRVSACLGWVHAQQGPQGAEELLAAAEGALARAKADGAGHSHVFDPAEQLLEQSRRWMREQIDLALAAGDQFQLHYQPFVRLGDRSLLGFEALIRWRHPVKGLVMPGDFIPVAEESGQIAAIGRWTLLEAAAQLRRWHGLGFRGEIAVNLSGVQLARDLELMADARATLAALGEVPVHQLKLEVTESMAMAHPQRSAELLQELARLGFKLSIDDFGTGYSSLAYLHRFPFDTLKVDRSFVIRLAAGREAQEIVRTIVGLALALGKQTLAEGVEDEAQAALLLQLGVQVGQGWLFAKALPAAEAERWVLGEGPRRTV
ncbi:EAL domain-containing protein [Paucibacter soli]|uniref:EAL domain-containing protein n=1 Tax=Paucibacter soli TaxID=3133433 RepID=UPI0030B58CA2